MYKNNVPQDEALWLSPSFAKAVTMNESELKVVHTLRPRVERAALGQCGWGSRREWFPKWDHAFREAVRRSGVDICLAA